MCEPDVTAPVRITTPVRVEVDFPITVGQFIKTVGLAATGGEAKQLVLSGMIRVNGYVETRRNHRLAAGDVLQVDGAPPHLVVEARSLDPGFPERPADSAASGE